VRQDEIKIASDRRDGLDFAAFNEFLISNLGLSGAARITPATGGQSNPTFFVEIDDRQLVLRTKPAGTLAASAHAIEREYRILQALSGTDVPVPAPILYHADNDVLGRPFYVMERIAGHVFHDAALEPVPREKRRGLFMSMAQGMGALHRVDWSAVGLDDYGRATQYFERQLSRWGRFWQEHGLGENQDLDAVIAWLLNNVPASDTAAINHGDFRIANMLFDSGLDRLAAVLDWELSTIGHPLADAAFSCLAYHSAPADNGGVMGLDLEQHGIPSQDEYLAAYYDAVGTAERLEPFHMIFALFRAGVGAESIASRAAQGQGMDHRSAEFGRRLGKTYARRARDLISGVA